MRSGFGSSLVTNAVPNDVSISCLPTTAGAIVDGLRAGSVFFRLSTRDQSRARIPTSVRAIPVLRTPKPTVVTPKLHAPMRAASAPPSLPATMFAISVTITSINPTIDVASPAVRNLDFAPKSDAAAVRASRLIAMFVSLLYDTASFHDLEPPGQLANPRLSLKRQCRR